MANDVNLVRHSAAHVMAEAVLHLYPGAKFGIGPAIDEGFYYDFLLPAPIANDDLPAIEKEMRRIISGGHAFTRREVSKEEAKQLFADQPFKLELIDELEDGTI
ncbi:threonine--tRNA ligase, partial [bacterium]|nr:threonine--tRNA ligase [bacterium]